MTITLTLNFDVCRLTSQTVLFLPLVEMTPYLTLDQCFVNSHYILLGQTKTLLLIKPSQ